MSSTDTFEITAEWIDGAVLLSARGELDLAASAAWDACVSDVLEQMPSGLTLDLGATTFVDSSGLRLILLLTQEVTAREVSLGVVNISAPVARLLEVTGLTDIIDP